MGQNIKTASLILKSLFDQGVRTLCLCPGARNAPFVSLLSKSLGFEIISFFDERSAGFFALGRIQRDKSAVAVLTTSGTAVSELLSAVIEAHYSSLPLVVLSADRPRNLRHTGAPQTIDQTQIFSKFVSQSWDITDPDDCDIIISSHKPVHINVCFQEPLVDQEFSEVTDFSRPSTILRKEKVSQPKYFDQFLVENQIQLERPLIILSGMNQKESENVAQLLQNYEGPIFAEALSRLKNHPLLKSKLIKGGERAVGQVLLSPQIKSVLRIGDVPLGRYWRDVDQIKIPVISISSKEFSGSKESLLFQTDLTMDFLNSKNFNFHIDPTFDYGEDLSEKIKNLARSYPQSEANLFLNLLNSIKNEHSIYVGNSLPVRWLDLFDDQHSQIFASRGVNGIDGQLSTALGLCQPHQTMWVILGDLTTLYDFSAFWLTDYLRQNNFTVNIAVINNKGGQIFSRLFKEELFLNRHDKDFKKIAEMWGWSYQSSQEQLDAVFKDDLNILEILPDEISTKNFWKEYDQLWIK